MEDDDIIPGDNLTKLLSPLGCFYGPKFWHQTVATHERYQSSWTHLCGTSGQLLLEPEKPTDFAVLQ
ncbi:hypothetical protein Y1Q_0014165 [Alligator mississippiensis]|uniref:Uncharacterized protein n=1 Tax=Alligator mississippiensis TaxID=8496 RepID=A0A151MU25_ALLMI|nr:hypothetical protein Y1Q_0014165 [Alligator mississippiensis]